MVLQFRATNELFTLSLCMFFSMQVNISRMPDAANFSKKIG
jgi:hypothetical protein